MIAVGIDPGTSCGVAVVSETHVAWVTVTLPSWRYHADGAGDGQYDCYWMVRDSIREVCKLVAGDFALWLPEVAAIEDSQHAMSMRAAAVQAEHLTICSLACTGIGGPIIPVNPATWQRGLVGALGRDEYVRYAVELTGGELDPRHHDAAAAICIAEWAWQQAREAPAGGGP